MSLNRSADAVAGWRADQGVADQATHNAGPHKDASPAVHTIELRKDFHGTIALPRVVDDRWKRGSVRVPGPQWSR